MNTKLNRKRKKNPVSMIGLLVFTAVFIAACTTAAPTTQEVSTPGAFQGAGSPTPASSLPTPVTAANTPVTTPMSTDLPASVGEAELNVATDPVLGDILVDGKGMTLYMFKNDERDKSNCDADCLAKWPPLLTQGNPIAGPGVDSSQIGTATLADGSLIVTYDHRPLYYWIQDSKPGDTTGQGVGDVWFVMSPTGEEIDDLPASTSGTAAPAASANEPTINVASTSALGEFLVDGEGMTLYMFTRDTADQSNCSGDCLVAWPPLLTQGSPVLGPGVDDSLIGSAPLPDGTMIVTYNHMPLYYYYEDLNAGDVTGQGVGSVWYVVSPEGEIIRD
jgi:predicted lipoprotein with Yx(FWY)xxD motif